MANFTLLLLAVSSVFSAALANPHQPRHAAHERAVRRSVSNGRDWKSDKRETNARFSYYDVQTGNQVACGGFHQNTDFIVALNVAQWDGGAHCGKAITVSYQGKTSNAVIVDQCPGCPYGGLDLSPSLFGSLSDLGAGIIYGEWDYVGDAPASPPPATTSSTPTPPPPPPPSTSSTWSPTSTWTPTTTSHSTSSTSTTSSSSSSSVASSSDSSSAASTVSNPIAAAPAPSAPGSIQALYGAVVGLGYVPVDAAQTPVQVAA